MATGDFPGVRTEQGGLKIVVPSGCTIEVESGGVLNMKTGALSKANGTQAAAIVDLVSSAGSADDTIADVGGAFNQTTLNNNFADLGAKFNALLAACRGAGIVAP